MAARSLIYLTITIHFSSAANVLETLFLSSKELGGLTINMKYRDKKLFCIHKEVMPGVNLSIFNRKGGEANAMFNFHPK